MRIVVCAGISGALTLVPDHAWLPVNDLTGSPCAFAIACGVAVAQSFCAHTALAALIPTPLPAPTPTALSASPAPPAAAPWCAVHTAMGRDTDKLRTAMAASTDPYVHGWIKSEKLAGEAQRALFQISALLSARVRERRPAFCFCKKAALWCGCAGCALRRGKADLRKTAQTALAPGRPDR